jgi:type II secretory pathway predicted ATPase ExeA
MTYLERFGLAHRPLPRGACGPTFYDRGEDFARLARIFAWLTDEPGLGVLVGDPGTGKTASIRHLCALLPRPRYRVLYHCDATLPPTGIYRALAGELGLRPHHRRSQLWTDIKRTMLHLVDEQNVQPVLVLDEAHLLPDAFLHELAAFLNYAFDSRDLVTTWLVGQPALHARLQTLQHEALAMRVVAPCHLHPRLDRAAFLAMLDHALRTAGATRSLLSEPAAELVFRACRGLPRLASKLLHAALILADSRDQAFLDDSVISAAIADLSHELPTNPDPLKPRAQTGTKSRK